MKTLNFSVLRTRTLAAGLLLAGTLFLSSCLKNKDDFENPDSNVAGLMAFNLAPDKSAIDVTIDGSRLTNNPLPYTNFTGGYLGIVTGNRAVESYDATSSSELASSTYLFDTLKYYSTFLVGLNGVYDQLITHDDFDALSPTSNQAFVRYVNAIPDSAQPVVTIGPDGGSNVINEPARFKAYSTFKAVDPGTVRVSINDGGSISTQRTLQAEQRKVYTVLLVGNPASSQVDSVQIKFVENGSLSEQR